MKTVRTTRTRIKTIIRKTIIVAIGFTIWGLFMTTTFFLADYLAAKNNYEITPRFPIID